MSISSSITTSAPAPASEPTITSSSRSTTSGANERRSASLPPAATIARSGRKESAASSWAREHLAREEVAAAEVEHLELLVLRVQRLGDPVDPGEVAVAVVRLAHPLGDAVTDDGEAAPGSAGQGVRDGHRFSFAISHSAVTTTATEARVQNR